MFIRSGQFARNTLTRDPILWGFSRNLCGLSILAACQVRGGVCRRSLCCTSLTAVPPIKRAPIREVASNALKLRRDFYGRATLQVARELIGMHLVHDDEGTRRVGRIVETEAYQGPADQAAHSARGLTPRNAVMFGPPGHAYVYFIYGFWNCLNIVTREQGVPHAVLLRALEPVMGVTDKTWGPGLLCRAMHIDRRLNGADLCRERLWLERPPRTRSIARVARATRIGVAYAGEWAARPWRFFDRDSAFVSTVTAAARARAIRGVDQDVTLRSKGPAS
jgi:DNA-3-methyladenine glycosylase